MNKLFSKISINAPVTLGFSLICLIALGLSTVFGERIDHLLLSTYRSSPLDPLTYVRLFTHVFGHVSYSHFSGNIIIILMLGPMIEEKYGSTNLAIMIAITALVTALVNDIFFNTALMGASGIVYMLIVLTSFSNLEKGKLPLTLLVILIFVLGKEIVGMVMYDDNISQLTHVVGGVCGLLFGKIFNKE